MKPSLLASFRIADFAVLISKVLKSSPKMWMNLQIQLDIWGGGLKKRLLEVI